MNHEITNTTKLSIDQQKTLVEIISEQSGHNLTFDEFTDQVLMLFEDISGFEVITDSDSKISSTSYGVNIMVPTNETTITKKPDLNKANIKKAIVQGKEMIKSGMSKADVSREIYDLVKLC